MTSGQNHAGFQAAVIIAFLLIAVLRSGLLATSFPRLLHAQEQSDRRPFALVISESVR
jgi:hypothetical protein